MSNVISADHTEMRALTSIRPYEKNPRKNEKTISLLCKMIPKVGFNVPLVIDEDGVIVKGHARYEAAKRLGMKEVPCIITHADKDAIRADRIADNKVQEFSKWNNEELMHEVDMLDLDYDFSDMGLPRATFDDFSGVDFLDDYEEPEETEFDEESLEEKRQRYLKLLEKQAAEEENVQITTEYELRKAVMNQKEIPQKQKQYIKCTCKRCGNVFYFDKNTYYDKNGTTKR